MVGVVELQLMFDLRYIHFFSSFNIILFAIIKTVFA